MELKNNQDNQDKAFLGAEAALVCHTPGRTIIPLCLQSQHYLTPPATPVLLLSWCQSEAPYGVVSIQKNTKLLAKHQYTACTKPWEVAVTRAQAREGMCGSLSAVRKIVRRYSWKGTGRESWRDKKVVMKKALLHLIKASEMLQKEYFFICLPFAVINQHQHPYPSPWEIFSWLPQV